MKLTEEQKERFESCKWDNENVHGMYDKIMSDRLKELDPELMADLIEATKDVTFWYA